jgi:polyphosphate glucokinase
MADSPCTLTVDCGGTGLKAAVLGPDGAMVSERVRVLTPYPCPPEVFVRAIRELVAQLPAYDRVSVGLPGLVRDGRVLATPHYVTVAGPFTARSPDLEAAWSGLEISAILEDALERPTRVVNDAEMQGAAVIRRAGYEVTLTLGTGLGFAQFQSGRLLPKVELSQHPFRKGETYDEQLGDAARRTVGNAKWNRRVARAIATLRPVLWWDALYVGGGGAKHVSPEVAQAFGGDVTLVPNAAGLLGGARLWDDTSLWQR